jgi:hypothetical protein
MSLSEFHNPISNIYDCPYVHLRTIAEMMCRYYKAPGFKEESHFYKTSEHPPGQPLNFTETQANIFAQRTIPIAWMET